jgi:translation elongation factor EF-4
VLDKIYVISSTSNNLEDFIESELNPPSNSFSKVRSKIGLKVEDPMKRIVDEILPPKDLLTPS